MLLPLDVAGAPPKLTILGVWVPTPPRPAHRGCGRRHVQPRADLLQQVADHHEFKRLLEAGEPEKWGVDERK